MQLKVDMKADQRLWFLFMYKLVQDRGIKLSEFWIHQWIGTVLYNINSIWTYNNYIKFMKKKD